MAQSNILILQTHHSKQFVRFRNFLSLLCSCISLHPTQVYKFHLNQDPFLNAHPYNHSEHHMRPSLQRWQCSLQNKKFQRVFSYFLSQEHLLTIFIVISFPIVLSQVSDLAVMLLDLHPDLMNHHRLQLLILWPKQ